jgi:hypothetical protein
MERTHSNDSALITMATPFLGFCNSRRDPLVTAIAAAGFGIWSAMAFLYSLVLLDRRIGDAFGVISFLTSLAAVFLAVATFSYWKMCRAHEAIPDLAPDAGASTADPARVLVLRGVDDEATHVIGFGALTAFAGASLGNILKALVVTLPVLIGASDYLARGVNKLLGAALPEAGDLSSFFYAIVVFTVPTLAAVFQVARSVFGSEFLWLGPSVLAWVNSAPDGKGNLDVVTLSSKSGEVKKGGSLSIGKFRRLNHYLYEHPDIAAKISEWIAKV